MLFLNNSRGNVSIIAQTKLRQLLKATYSYRNTEKYCSCISTSRRLGFTADIVHDWIWKITITTLCLEEETTFCWQCLTFQWPHSLSRKEHFKNSKVVSELWRKRSYKLQRIWELLEVILITGSFNLLGFLRTAWKVDTGVSYRVTKLPSDHEKCVTGFFLTLTSCITRR